MKQSHLVAAWVTVVGSLHALVRVVVDLAESAAEFHGRTTLVALERGLKASRAHLADHSEIGERKLRSGRMNRKSALCIRCSTCVGSFEEVQKVRVKAVDVCKHETMRCTFVNDEATARNERRGLLA